MKHLVFICTCMVLAASASSQDTIPGKIDQLISRYAACNKFNGTALVAVKGRILLEKGWGLKDVADQLPNEAHTIFRVGSITKEFTAAVVLKLAAGHFLELSDPLSKYFPGYPKGESITIENLLTQTSGIFNYTDVPDFWTLSGKPTTEQSVLDSIKDKPLLFPPGEKWSYSNSNYMLLAYIIQKVTRQSYESVVRKEVFEPAGMTHSEFDFIHLNSPDKATGYWNFSPIACTKGPAQDSTEFIGSGSLYSTAGDLFKWHQALQKGDILSPVQQKKAYACGKGPYGYGWELDSVAGKQIVGHGGRVFGFEVKMIRIPAEDIFIILLNNTADEPCIEVIGKGILAILFHRPITLPDAPIKRKAEQLRAYTGRFSPDGKRIFETMLVNGHLFGKESTDHPPMELFTIGGHRFMTLADGGLQLGAEFGLDEKETVKEITPSNPKLGRTLTIPKID